MKDDIGFKTYTYLGKPIIISKDEVDSSLMEKVEAYKFFSISTNHMYFKKPKDTRSKYRKFIDECKKRLSHAWYALKGGECD